MISKAKCVGLKVFKSKKGETYSQVYLDITEFNDNGKNEIHGSIVGSSFQRGKFNSNIVGQDILVSIDDFGNVKDIEI